MNTDELGSGKELVDKVSGLIAVFEDPAIDFRTNRATGDDIIGDAYEYFMMKFAQESVKSKGQFYTPSEVSRTIARLIGIGDITADDGKDWTLYDKAVARLIQGIPLKGLISGLSANGRPMRSYFFALSPGAQNALGA